jgi:hypothetical protein
MKKLKNKKLYKTKEIEGVSRNVNHKILYHHLFSYIIIRLHYAEFLNIRESITDSSLNTYKKKVKRSDGDNIGKLQKGL